KVSIIDKLVVLAEVLVGAVIYIMTIIVNFLVGFAILSVFIAVGMSVAGF
ncbi:type IV conjugative transfer system pilin TraA, partial [Escherichia coli]|nr:type IV conjugative transfer system pilin TraA [Escherichia coli]